jgi:hypothetical protein
MFQFPLPPLASRLRWLGFPRRSLRFARPPLRFPRPPLNFSPRSCQLRYARLPFRQRGFNAQPRDFVNPAPLLTFHHPPAPRVLRVLATRGRDRWASRSRSPSTLRFLCWKRQLILRLGGEKVLSSVRPTAAELAQP